jgi:hypothetical protein
MVFSSLSVVTNALRLRRFEAWDDPESLESFGGRGRQAGDPPTDKDTDATDAMIPRRAPTISNTLSVAVAADPEVTRRALNELDLAGQALAGRLAATVGGEIVVDAEARVEPDDEGRLTLLTRFSTADERAREHLLDAWRPASPLARELVRRAARAVRAHAEDDRFEHTGPLRVARAAA